MHFCNFVYQHETLHDCIFCQPLVEVGRAKKIIKKDINNKDVNKNKKHDMQWIFKKNNIFKRAIFCFEIGRKCE